MISQKLVSVAAVFTRTLPTLDVIDEADLPIYFLALCYSSFLRSFSRRKFLHIALTQYFKERCIDDYSKDILIARCIIATLRDIALVMFTQ